MSRDLPLRTTCILVSVLLAAVAAAGAEVRFFRLQSQQDYLSGTLDGIAVDPLGSLALADRGRRLADLGEPFLFAGARHPEGWVLGTGNAGKVLLVDREGGVRTLFTAGEPEIFAVAVDADGSVLAGSSPDGKVYRIRPDGSSETLFEPGETYIWGLARAADGSLLVATGTEGRLYRVDREGRGEVLYDGEDTHLRSLKVLPNGAVLVGSAGEGLILRIDPDGSTRTLFDARQPEVVAFAADEEGNCYAALLASEASLVDLARRGAAQQEKKGGEEEEDEEGAESASAVQITVTPAAPEQGFAGSRPRGFQGPRSEVLRISPEGVVESLWQFDQETVYTLLWRRGRLWVGTGLEGKLFSFRRGKMVLEKDVDERQVVSLLDDEPGPAFVTTNAAAFYRISSETERRGVYTSPALDAGQMARFGSLRWRGELPRGTRLEFSFRSGVSAVPDRTWTAWSEAARGPELSLAAIAPGRYLQWRAQFEAADGRSPVLGRVEVSYQQINLPPRIERLEVMAPGEILVPAGFNPANQVFEPAHPNREGIFTSLQPAGPAEERRKTLWKKGYRTLRWQAKDPNGDSLVYDLSFRPDGGGGAWLPMAEGIEQDFYSFDATALPDGFYRFRLRSADRKDRDGEPPQVAEETSEPVLIDNQPPRLEAVERRGGSFEVKVVDELEPLREAVFSIDAGDWRPARPADGILDGKRETLTVEAPPDAKLVLLRLTDAAFNVVTFDLGSRAAER